MGFPVGAGFPYRIPVGTGMKNTFQWEWGVGMISVGVLGNVMIQIFPLLSDFKRTCRAAA